MTEAVLDFETRSLCDLKRSGANKYASDLSTEILTLCWMVDDNSIEAWHPGEPIETTSLYYAIKRGALLVAHNAAFEKAIWRAIMVPDFGWPDVPNDQWHDTLAVCAMKAIPQGLDQATRVMRLKDLKDGAGSKFTIDLSKPDKRGNMRPLTSEIIQRVDEYCADDVYAQWGLHKRVGLLPEGERQVWLMDQTINERGFRIDVPLIKRMDRIVYDATQPLAKEFKELTGLNFTQRDKIKAWTANQGFPMPDLTADTVAGVLNYSPDLEPDEWSMEPVDMPDSVRRALSIRQLVGSAAVKKLHSAKECVMADGCVRGTLQYHGAGPGRWAGRLLQPHNFPRGTLKVDGEAPDIEPLIAALMTGDYEYVEMLYGRGAVAVVVSSLRHIIVPRRGAALVAGDFAGIEARITLALAGATTKTALMASGADVYCDMASQIFKRPIFKKTDPEERQIGKNSVLGLGFGMGVKKFLFKYCKDRTLDFCKGVVNTYRQEWAPEVPKLWYALANAAVRTVWDRRSHEAYGCLFQMEDLWLTMRLPSGRKLWYFNPQPVREAMPWDETDVREGFTYQARKAGKWVTIKAFGGLLTENVAQGLARDLLVNAMFKCEAEKMPVVLTVHDEIVSQVEENRADPAVLKQIMLDRPGWACNIAIPVDAECWAGSRYKK